LDHPAVFFLHKPFIFYPVTHLIIYGRKVQKILFLLFTLGKLVYPFNMKSPEEQIIDLLRARDQKAAAMLYDHYAASLYGIILKIVRQEDLAQDVLQEAFIKAWKNGSSYNQAKGSLFTWLLNIARNTAIDKTRSEEFQNRSEIQELDQAVYNNVRFSVEQNPEQIGLKRQVEKLEQKYRQVIDLIYFHGYTQKEVTEHLNIPLGTVKSRLRIGLRELKKVFSIYRIPLILLSISLGLL